MGPESGSSHLRDFSFVAKTSTEGGQLLDTSGVAVLVLLADGTEPSSGSSASANPDPKKVRLPADIETESEEFLVLRYKNKQVPGESQDRQVFKVEDDRSKANLFRRRMTQKFMGSFLD